MGLESKRSNRLLTSKGYSMKLKDLLQVMDDITQLSIVINDQESLYITDISKMPSRLFDYQINYIGAKCEDVLNIFLIKKK
jgi:hypothetical protein